jgi:hypothetical protein
LRLLFSSKPCPVRTPRAAGFFFCRAVENAEGFAVWAAASLAARFFRFYSAALENSTMPLSIIMTMLLVIASASGIYAAADGTQFPSGATTQKIFQVGNDALILQGGFALIPGGAENGEDWDARVEFRIIASSVTDDAPEQQFESLRKLVFENFSRALARYHGQIPSGKSLDFFFVRRFRAKNYVWFQKIAFLEVQPMIYEARLLEEPRFFDQGVYWSLPPECAMQQFDFSKGVSFVNISDLFRQVAGQSTACSNQIGEPIHIMFISDGGLQSVDR